MSRPGTRTLVLFFAVLGYSTPTLIDREERPDHDASMYEDTLSDEILDVDHEALRLVTRGPDCVDAVVKHADPRERHYGAPLLFEGIDGRCSARLIRAADVSLLIPAQVTRPALRTYRVGIAFTSVQSMNAWAPFMSCRAIDVRTVQDDWAVSRLGPRVKPRRDEPDRARYCPEGTPPTSHGLLLYYDADLVVVAVRTDFDVDLFMRPGMVPAE